MKEEKSQPEAIDAYIAQFPEDVQRLLARIREVVRAAAPQAVEKMGYGMPALYLNGYLVGYAAHKKHIGFYPAPTGLEAFAKDLAGYKGTKGSVHFPLDQPVPEELIARIVKFRIEENQRK